MAELDLVGSPNVDNQTAAKLGVMVSARFMVEGSYFDSYGNLRRDVRVINVETTELEMTGSVTGGDVKELSLNRWEAVRSVSCVFIFAMIR